MDDKGINNKTLAKIVSIGAGGALVGTLLGGAMSGRNLAREGYGQLFPPHQIHIEKYEPHHMTADELVKYHFGRLKGVDTKADPAKRPEVYNTMAYRKSSSGILENLQYAPKNSIEGRLQRLVIPEKLIDTVENIRHMPKDNTIAAILMEESYGGVPLQANELGDGGLGAGQHQGLRAKELGMRTIGDSKSYRDFEQGRKIGRLLKKCSYDISCVEKTDERANLLKAIDGVARNLEIGYQRYGNWDEAIQSHRGYVGKPKGIDYLKRINNWKSVLRDEKFWRDAIQDFEQRNRASFGEYRRLAGIAAERWGLFDYRGGPEVIRVYVPAARAD